ncbi:hypothetical protein [Acidithiobacillus ferrooxidans]|nr:hypothetical protein [Acidithiobacillus ferrooxidans]MBU2816091.1 hypothetical protein [Acidithiobacillus ferrooxidans]MCR1344038.1 hypothetical protein [Acidithiobacillus ferrooxidans]QLK41312.1 hypothetical protein FE661_03370 [Acidithiobacillus ferrooxidans]QZT53254.1 hypothetical protein K7B00_03370 [Acidithiobacillus ferrooxidans]BDB13350.1 hypothetical protein ANFP_06700 [Acidithiobacillus ferrooxidans]
MSALDSILWDIEDYACRTFDVIKLSAALAFTVARVYPFVVGGLLLVLSGIGFWIDSSDAPTSTIQQQLLSHAGQGGTVYWAMQASGKNPSGFLGLDSFGDKKQEADFLAAVRFCNAHHGFIGCQKVTAAANVGMYGI